VVASSSGPTPSHSEQGRETLLYRWYLGYPRESRSLPRSLRITTFVLFRKISFGSSSSAGPEHPLEWRPPNTLGRRWFESNLFPPKDIRVFGGSVAQWQSASQGFGLNWRSEVRFLPGPPTVFTRAGPHALTSFSSVTREAACVRFPLVWNHHRGCSSAR
jgi:hypothetical protein